ncbi:hypothetical protein GQ600_26484 [Phytophthora cactorum]|nr:hypothetical protein GQ600_26484 [Phytophthora cactorum]
MYNATRFLDIGRLTAYIKKNARVDFELEGLDMCTPNSPASAVWKRTFKLAGYAISRARYHRGERSGCRSPPRLARPFASYKELRTSAAKRLQLQLQSEEEAQAEMTPAAKSYERGAASTAEATAKHSQNLAAGGVERCQRDTSPSHSRSQARVYHCPSIRRKEALRSQCLTGAKKQEAAPSRYDVLADHSDEEGDDEAITGEPAVAEI